MKLVLSLTLATTLAAFAQQAPSTNAAPVASAKTAAAPAPKKSAKSTATAKTKPGAKPAAATASATPAPSTNAASATPPPLPAVETPSAPEAPKVTLDSYLAELKDACALSKDEEQQVHELYLADGAAWQQALADPNLSPMQQEQKISDLRDARNGKIEALLIDPARQSAFRGVEAQYRVALDELAAVGGLTPVSKPPIAPSPSDVSPADVPVPKV